MALGALGVSVVSASGDDGVSGTRAGVQTCKNTRKFGVRFSLRSVQRGSDPLLTGNLP